jgi:hypothetical protein
MELRLGLQLGRLCRAFACRQHSGHFQASPGWQFVKRSTGGWIGLEDWDGVALRILTHSKPCNARDSNLGDKCFSAVFLDETGARID